MPKKKQYLPSKEQEAQLEELALFHATPAAKREYETVEDLAKAKGWVADRQYFELTESPEVFHRHMLKIAGSSLSKTPEILDALSVKAIAGNVKAAEVYLEWSRKLITDAKVIERMQPSVNPSDVLNTAIEGAHKLMQVAQAVPSASKAKEMIANAVEAEYGPA